MNKIEIRYSYFSSKPDVKINGEAISQYSDLITILARPFLEASTNLIHELDENEVRDEYEIDIYSTQFQYEILSTVATASEYCKAIHFHAMEALFSGRLILEKLLTICSRHKITLDKIQPLTVYNVSGVNLPHNFIATDKPNADIGLFRTAISSNVRIPVIVADSFDVQKQSKPFYCCIPEDKIDLLWDYYNIMFFTVPMISECLTALKYVELSDIENTELNAIKTGKPSYYISELPQSIDQGDSCDLVFKSFPEKYYSLIVENSNIISYENDKITAKNSGSTNLIINDESGVQIASKYINVIEHHYAREIRLVPRFKYLGRNERGQIDVIVTPPNVEDANRLAWSVSDTNIIQINENGSIVALEDGTATITVEGHTTKTELKVEIKPVLRSLSFSQDIIKMKGGDIVVIECNITPSNAPADKLIWEVDNKVIATANPSKDGRKCQIIASGTYEGTGNIRCYDPETRIAASCRLEVNTSDRHTTAGKITFRCMCWGFLIPILFPVSIVAGLYGLCTDNDPASDSKGHYIWCPIVSTIMLLGLLSAMR